MEKRRILIGVGIGIIVLGAAFIVLMIAKIGGGTMDTVLNEGKETARQDAAEKENPNSLETDTVYLATKDNKPRLILNEIIYTNSEKLENSPEDMKSSLSTYDLSAESVTPLMKLPDSNSSQILGSVTSAVDERIVFSLYLEPLISYLIEGPPWVEGSYPETKYFSREDILFEYSALGLRMLTSSDLNNVFGMAKYRFAIPLAYSPDGNNLIVRMYSCYWCDSSSHGAAVIPTPYGTQEFIPGRVPPRMQIVESISDIEWVDNNFYRYKKFVISKDCSADDLNYGDLGGPCYENPQNVPWIQAEVPREQLPDYLKN